MSALNAVTRNRAKVTSRKRCVAIAMPVHVLYVIAAARKPDRSRWRSSSFANRCRVEPEHDHLRVHGLRGPREHRKTSRHGDLLRTARCVRDHTAADRAAEILPPELLSGGGIERIENAAHVADERDAPRSGRQAAGDRVVGLDAPFPDAGVGVDGVDPTRPVLVLVELAEYPEGVDGRHACPWLTHADSSQLSGIFRPCALAILDLAHEDQVCLRNVGGAVPFGATG